MKAKTYQEIASNYELWGEFVDVENRDSKKDFDSQTVTEKIAFITRCFGPETTPDPTEI